MKSQLITTSVFVACLAGSSSAQSPIHALRVKNQLDASKVTPQPAGPQLPGAPLVGGADSCVTPDVISGGGPFAFDNSFSSSGPQAQTEGICKDYNTTGINNDVWFKWTATFTGNAEVSLCNTTTVDTRVAAYAGTTCPVAGSALACNDDYCGNQSRVNFLCTAGSSYVLQVGTYPGAAGGTGTFTITQYAPPPGDDCSSPIALPGPGTYGFDTTPATTSFQGQAEPLCLPANSTQIDDDLWYAYTAGVNGTATVTTCGLMTISPTQDTKLSAFPGPGCPVLGTAVGCNDDDLGCVVSNLNSTMSFTVTCGQSYLIQVGRYPNTGGMAATGQFTLSEFGGGSCAPSGTPYCFGDGSSTACPCGNNGATGNGCASSVSSNGANLATTGSASLTMDTLVLSGTGMPNSTCLYFQGTTQISTLFGDGLRCAGGSIARLGTKTNAAGASQYPTGADAAVHVKGNVTTPGTRTYQVWYRNAAAFCTASTFNLSNGVLVTWQ